MYEPFKISSTTLYEPVKKTINFLKQKRIQSDETREIYYFWYKPKQALWVHQAVRPILNERDIWSLFSGKPILTRLGCEIEIIVQNLGDSCLKTSRHKCMYKN